MTCWNIFAVSIGGEMIRLLVSQQKILSHLSSKNPKQFLKYEDLLKCEVNVFGFWTELDKLSHLNTSA